MFRLFLTVFWSCFRLFHSLGIAGTSLEFLTKLNGPELGVNNPVSTGHEPSCKYCLRNRLQTGDLEGNRRALRMGRVLESAIPGLEMHLEFHYKVILGELFNLSKVRFFHL